MNRIRSSIEVPRLARNLPRSLLLGLACALASVALAADPEVLDRGTYLARDGSRFTYEKVRTAGGTAVVFRRGSLELDRAGMRRFEAEHPPPKAESALVEAAATEASARADAELPLLVVHRHQPAARIARTIRDRYAGAHEALGGDVRALRATLGPPLPLDAEAERTFARQLAVSGGGLTAAQRAEVERLGGEIEALRDEARRELAASIAAAVAQDQAWLDLTVTTLGGRVARAVPTANAVAARLPAASLPLLLAEPAVARVELLAAGVPELDVQKRGLGLDVTGGFWDDGFTGTGLDAGVLDTGVQQDHPALDHLAYETMAGTTDTDGHGTAVAGIVASNDAGAGLGCFNDGRYCGVAWNMDTLLVGSFAAMDVLGDADWMVTTATEGPEAINLSAGYGTADDVDYAAFDAFFDALVDDHGVTVCTSAGDGGNASATTITHPANAYNAIALANIDDQNTTTRADDIVAASSSRGPTLGGRKKPDLTAPGELTHTTDNDWATGPDFLDVSGTSAAAPHCTGAALLIAEQRGSADPLATKALLINTADAWSNNGTPTNPADDGPVAGSEWNETYGWGYLDLEEAHINALDVLTGTVAEPAAGATPSFRLFQGLLDVDEKLTLAWNRHVGYAGAVEPTAIEDLTDLDLELYVRSTGDLSASSASLIDNVEQVSPAAPASVFVAKVAASGPIDPDVGTETFALAAEEGWLAATPPGFDVEPPKRPFSPGRPFRLWIDVDNTGDVQGFDPIGTLTLPAGYDLLAGANPQPYFQFNTFARFLWNVRAPCTMDGAVGNLDVTATGYGETFAGSGDVPLQPTITGLPPDDFQLEIWVDRTYELPLIDGSWSVMAMRPRQTGGGVLDLWADDDMCIGSPYQMSTQAGSLPELVLANGALLGDATHYALVRHALGSVEGNNQYWIEHEPATELALGAPPVTATFTSLRELVEVFQMPVVSGRFYQVSAVEIGSHTVDLALLGYAADRTDGEIENPTFLQDARDQNDNSGESLIIQAGADGVFAIVLLNKLEFATASGSFAVRAVEALFADGFESGDTSAWSQTIP